MLTVLSIFGTRPEAIKMAPVVRALAAQPDRIKSVVCSTGQHREMLDQVLALFDLQPDCELNVMQPDQTLAGLTARLLAGIDEQIARHQPAWVVSQGDTTTAMVAALAAFYRRVPFAHVEAGLRTHDLAHPFPEEFNRRVADLVAARLFPPTELSRRALLAEGVPAEKIIVTGNTVIDALHHVAALPYDWRAGPLAEVPRENPLVLITAHRRESFGQPLRDICQAIRALAAEFPRIAFVFPVHLNPQVQTVVREFLSGLPNVHLLPPLDYLALVQVMKHSRLILTDSGGIQEEAPGLKVPVLVLREATERPEGVEAGVVRLVGSAKERIIHEASLLLTDEAARAAMCSGVNPYGDGQAAQRIVAALLTPNA